MNSIVKTILVFAFMLTCASSAISQKEMKKPGVTNLLILPVISNINLIEQKDKLANHETYSITAETKIKSNVDNYLPSEIEKVYMQVDDSVESRLIKLCLQLESDCHAAKSSKRIQSLEIPAELLTILETQQEDFALFICQTGFTRTVDNLKTEYIKRRYIALASLGYYDTVPNEANSAMAGFVIDKKNKKVVWYRSIRWINRDPNDDVVIKTQVRDIILSCF